MLSCSSKYPSLELFGYFLISPVGPLLVASTLGDLITGKPDPVHAESVGLTTPRYWGHREGRLSTEIVLVIPTWLSWVRIIILLVKLRSKLKRCFSLNIHFPLLVASTRPTYSVVLLGSPGFKLKVFNCIGSVTTLPSNPSDLQMRFCS